MALLYRAMRTIPSLHQRWQHAWMLPPLTIWICVSITLRYGYYGDSCILLRPASSRSMKTSSVFVKQLQVSNEENNQVILRAFNEESELSSQTNWTVSNFFLVEAYKSKVDGGSYVEISFLARVLTYILLLGALMIVIYLVLKFLGVYEGGDQNSHAAVDVTYRTSNVVARPTETEPLMQVETNRLTYRTNVKDDEEEDSGASSSSSEELYDGKLCCICYDEQRSSFFVPCGHCATCYDCAPRILDEESIVCPICRRLIHNVRRLYHN